MGPPGPVALASKTWITEPRMAAEAAQSENVRNVQSTVETHAFYENAHGKEGAPVRAVVRIALPHVLEDVDTEDVGAQDVSHLGKMRRR